MNKKIQTKIGAHISIAGGIDNAPSRAAENGCEVFQCFTRSPRGGKAPELTEKIVGRFKSEMKKFNIDNFYIHTPYYINLASLNNKIRFGSIRVIREELERGSLLGSKFIMTHLGSYKDQPRDKAVAKVIGALKESLKNYKGKTELLLEISAGSGNILGDSFGELGCILSDVSRLPGFGGICFDTCHAFASGYDFTSSVKAKATLKEFDKNIGLKWLKLSHIQDSKAEAGERKDRHEHIGKGKMGRKGLEAILRTDAFGKIDWILETEPVGRKNDMRILKEIRDSL